MKRRLLTLISCVMIVVLMASSAAATVTPRYDYIGMCYARLTIEPNGLAKCYSTAEMTNLSIVMNMELQKRSGSGPWEYVKDWDVSGSRVVELNKTWYVASGYDYQLEITVDIYSGDVCVETITEYSDIVEF